MLSLYDQVAATGLPHCVQVRPGADRVAEACLADRGLVVEGQVPLMLRVGAEPARANGGDLEIREVGPADLGHVKIDHVVDFIRKVSVRIEEIASGDGAVVRGPRRNVDFFAPDDQDLSADAVADL